MKTNILLLSFLLILSACKKNKEYIVKGRILCSCSSWCEEKEFQLYQDNITLTSIGGVLTSFKTDQNGYFEVKYKAKNRFKIKLRQGSIIMDEIPVFKNVDLGTIYLEPIIKDFSIKLTVSNTYTSSATLYYYFGTATTTVSPNYIFKAAGPFTNGELEVIQHYMFHENVIKYGEPSNLQFNYFLNDLSAIKSIYLPIEPCASPQIDVVIPVQ